MLSPYLQHYIKKTGLERNINMPNTLDEFLSCQYKDKSLPFDLFQTICTDNNENNKHFNHKQLIQDCLDLGVKIDYVREKTSYPPMFYASTKRPDLAMFMIEKGAYNENVKAVLTDNRYESLLHFSLNFYADPASIPDKIKLWDALYEIEGFVPGKTIKGKPLLHCSNEPLIAQWLLDKGENPLLYTTDGAGQHNAFDFFKEHPSVKTNEILKIFEHHIAKIKAQEEKGVITKTIKAKFKNKKETFPLLKPKSII